MSHLAIISNAASGRNRHRQSLLAHLEGVRLYQAGAMEALPELLEEVLATGPAALVFDGGDGTVQRMVTVLLRRYPVDALPALAILPAGSTNMTARDVGSGTNWRAALQRLLELRDVAPADWPVTRRRALVIRRDDDAAPDYGFFMGTGTIVRGIEYWHDEMAKGGALGEWGAGLALLRAAWGIWQRQPPFADPAHYRLRFGDGELREGSALFVLITTMHELFLGIRPFWGEGDAPIACTLVSDEPRQFVRRIPGLLRGDPGVGLRPEEGFDSLRTAALELELPERFAIDGELYDAAACLRVSTTEPLRFVRLAGAR